MGPSELSPETVQQFLNLVRVGNARDVAATAAGIDPALLRAYCEAGRTELSGPHRDFLNAIEKAEAEALALDVTRITKAATAGSLKAAALSMKERRRQTVIRILRGGR